MLQREDYIKAVSCYQNILDSRLCPKCGQGHLSILLDFEKQTTNVECNYCSLGKWINWETYTKEYNRNEKYKSYNKFMHKLKKDEFKNSLSKHISHVISKGEDIITKKDYQDAILNNPISMISLYNNSDKIMHSLKLCSKSELTCLQAIINMGISSSVENPVEIKGLKQSYTLKLCRITSIYPITYEVCKKSELPNAHGILTYLMSKGLISVNEEENYIVIHPNLLFDSMLSTIDKLLVQEYVLSEEETYKVYQSNNFRCSNCGEAGMPLKVAFLTKQKKFNSTVPVCSICYDSITENKVIIDGSLILFDNMYKIKSWLFVKKYVPNFSERYFKEFYLLSMKYGENNMIKAVAQGLFRMKSGKAFSKQIYFYKYILKILDSAAKEGKDVSISELVMEQYNVNQWCELEDSL